ncbi:hypothetical protein Tco_1198110 [Tanacetum coccineum]
MDPPFSTEGIQFLEKIQKILLGNRRGVVSGGGVVFGVASSTLGKKPSGARGVKWDRRIESLVHFRNEKKNAAIRIGGKMIEKPGKKSQEEDQGGITKSPKKPIFLVQRRQD